ncbi:MAG TPA: energy transducer TonB [Nevskiaceae bacterium]|nr:energy transducer TonB [Nevskiaceae bacterium]
MPIRLLLGASLAFLTGCAGMGLSAQRQPVAPVPTVQNDAACNSRQVLSRAAPQYPTEAARIRQAGWVVVRYEIDPAGVPAALTVDQASPVGVFEAVTLAAMAQWRFAPADAGSSGCWQLMKYDIG